MILYSEYDRVMQTRDRIKLMPWINFPRNWSIRILPPFSGACVRFQVRNNEMCPWVSVYLDMDQNLGYYGVSGKEPYWEVYPVDEDVVRCAKDDIESLMVVIKKSLKQQNKRK